MQDCSNHSRSVLLAIVAINSLLDRNINLLTTTQYRFYPVIAIPLNLCLRGLSSTGLSQIMVDHKLNYHI